jgi:hypothetical protein
MSQQQPISAKKKTSSDVFGCALPAAHYAIRRIYRPCIVLPLSE